jgi:hypothetical protein
MNQVGMSDDWVGARINAFVTDYVFDRPSVIAETMEELAPPTCKVCGDSYSAHQHYRYGTDCAQCPCPQYRATTTRAARDTLSPIQRTSGSWPTHAPPTDPGPRSHYQVR